MRTVVLINNLLHPLARRLQDTLRKGLGTVPVFVTFDQAQTILPADRPDMLMVLLSPAREQALDLLRRQRDCVAAGRRP